MPTVETNRKLATLGVFVLPVVLVKVAGVLLSPVPAQAEMDLAPAVAPPPEGAGVEPGPLQVSEEAAHYALTVRSQPLGAVPLFYETLDDTGAGSIILVPGEDPPPDFVVSMILGSTRGNTALIDNEAYRVGDLLGNTTWRITEINQDTRSVTIADMETERTMTRAVENPFDS